MTGQQHTKISFWFKNATNNEFFPEKATGIADCGMEKEDLPSDSGTIKLNMDQPVLCLELWLFMSSILPGGQSAARSPWRAEIVKSQMCVGLGRSCFFLFLVDLLD